MVGFVTFKLVGSAYLLFSLCIQLTVSHVPSPRLVLSSCLLSTGCHIGSSKVCPYASSLAASRQLVSTSSSCVSMAHQRITFVHLLNPYVTVFIQPFPTRSAPWIFTTAPVGRLNSTPWRWVRGALPSSQWQLRGTLPPANENTWTAWKSGWESIAR